MSFVHLKSCAAIALAFLGGALSPAQGGIDSNRARELPPEQQDGRTLAPEERDHLLRAPQERRAGSAKAKSAPAAEMPSGSRPAVDPAGLIPLSEMTAGQDYKGQDGGLYGEGRNEPPPAHREAALKEAAQIAPLDPDGRPSPGGRIVLLGVGMSNTTMEYRRFREIADADPAKSPRVIIVDGAQGGQDARITADPAADFWPRIDARLRMAGVTEKQVQVVWLKQAIARIGGDFPASAQRLRDCLAEIVGILKTRYPNARLCYLSSRIYAGYAATPLNPEPYAYEGAFAVRWLIADQIRGDAALNFDPARGAVAAPLLLWGPYLWAQGETPRKPDGLAYHREDFAERDGTHPTKAGAQKVAGQLLRFFKSEPTAAWFLAPPEAKADEPPDGQG